MPWTVYELLNHHRAVAERFERFVGGCRHFVVKCGGIADSAHSSSAAACRGFCRSMIG